MLAELPRIQPTPLGEAASGLGVDRAMQELLEQAAVERRYDCLIEGVYSDGDVVVDCGDRRWSCRGAVFGPNGTEPGIDVEGSAALQGFGVSYSASDDGAFFLSRRVAVYGDAPRVIEHAWIAAKYASDVVVLMKEGSTESPVELVTELRSSPAVTFEHGAVLRSLLAGDDGLLTAVELDAASGRRTIDVSALFVAQHLVPVTEVVRGGSPDQRIAFAGLAAGIDYWNHAALVDNGARAARTLLTAFQS